MTGAHLSLADPGNSASIVVAADWIRSAMTGTLATIVATVAIAGIGLLMLQGRLPLRRGLGVVLGCFIIFGASMIADGLSSIGDATGGGQTSTPISGQEAVPPPAAVKPPPQPQVYDPYAGASVPVR